MFSKDATVRLGSSVPLAELSITLAMIKMMGVTMYITEFVGDWLDSMTEVIVRGCPPACIMLRDSHETTHRAKMQPRTQPVLQGQRDISFMFANTVYTAVVHLKQFQHSI